MTESNAKSDAAPKKKGLSGFQKTILYALVLLFAGSLVARAALGGGASESGSDSGRTALAPGSDEAGGKGFLPGLDEALGGSAESPAESGSIEALLPVFTEASFFGLIGFALGYASRKILKLGLIFLAVFFVGVQGLVHAEIIQEVDWPKAIDYVNNFVLNLKENNTFSDWLTDRVPTAGSLIGGYLFGLRRG